jgi:hypothetical protein
VQGYSYKKLNVMKRISLLILAVLSMFIGVTAQNLDDALRYSQISYGGTARFMSMGGAFTSLGGDISSLSQNPAGIGVFRASEFTITPQLFQIKTTAGFNGRSISNLSNFNLNQIGLVSNLVSNNKETGLVTLNIGYSFIRNNNLSQSIVIHGINNSSSMTDYWALQGKGFTKVNLPDDPWMAFHANLIDTLSGSATSYGTVYSNYGDNPPSVYGQTVQRIISYEGYTAEHAISIGGNYSNKLFFGATLGISKLRFSSHIEHLETSNSALPNLFQSFVYTNHFEEKGTGYSIKMGAIFKPTDAVRIGFAFHSPTWYKIDDYAYSNITAKFTDGYHSEASIDPSRYNYALATPFRVLTGASVRIKKIALISADYEYVDYSTSRFSETGDGYDFGEKNMAIRNTLKSASNIRLGGELRLNKLYLRSGYGYYGKAFKPGEDNANLDYRSISFGAGFREQNVSIDFAYTNYKSSQKYYMYPLDQSFVPSLVNFNTMKNMFTLTIGYKFGI